MKKINHIVNFEDKERFEIIYKNEECIDDLCFKYREIASERIKENKEDSETGIIYAELLIDFERIGDHIMNIAESLYEDYE